MDHPTLSKAPIREAIIDLQYGAELPSEFIQRSVAHVEKSFSQHKKILFGQVTMQFGTDPAPPTISNEEYGSRLEDDAGSTVLQLRRNGFTFSYVGKYSTWKVFSAEAKGYWDRLESVQGSSKVSRIATRFINQIPLGPRPSDLDQILTVGPKIPDQLPQGLSGFLSRIVIPFQAQDAVAIVTQALEVVSPELQNIILDIDVYQSALLNANDEQIWRRLEMLRDIKNEVFFTFLTPSTIESFR